MRTQLEMWRAAERRAAAANQTFLELVTHPTNPLTGADLIRLIERFPERWSRFSGWVGKLKGPACQP